MPTSQPTPAHTSAPTPAPAQHVLDLLTAHRSIRAFKDEPIPYEHVTAAIAAGQAASTSSAVQAYGCLRVTDAAKRAEIAELAGPQEKVRVAPEFFVFFGDTRRHHLATQRQDQPSAPSLETFLLAVIDTALFAEKTAIAFEAMGYGICYIGGIRNDLPRLDRILNLPAGVLPFFGMCVGLPDQAPSIRPRLPLDAILLENAYPDDNTMNETLDRYDETYRSYLADRGADPRGWSEAMARKFAARERTGLADYYAAKGARLDAGDPARDES